MTQEHHEYIDFLRYCLHDSDQLPASAKDIDWQHMLDFARKQSIVGVMFHGIKRLKAQDPHPAARTLAQWGVNNQGIIDANKQVYADAYKVINTIYHSFGHRSCLLKGQGNAMMYPDKYMRTPGDIDLWVLPNEGEGIADIIHLCRKITPGCEVVYHHSHNDNLAETFVELHFRPSYSENLLYNHRLQQYFIDNAERQSLNIVELPDGLGKVCVPSDDFNRLFQLSHIMKHFVFEGIGVGLRHIIDYYYLLRKGSTAEEKIQFERMAKHLGMIRFARGLMYVMQHYLGLEEQYLLVKPSKSLGRYIMEEILKTGNFGQDDKRFEGMSSDKPLLSATFSVIRVARLGLKFPASVFLGHIPWILWWHFYYKKKTARIANGES